MPAGKSSLISCIVQSVTAVCHRSVCTREVRKPCDEENHTGQQRSIPAVAIVFAADVGLTLSTIGWSGEPDDATGMSGEPEGGGGRSGEPDGATGTLSGGAAPSELLGGEAPWLSVSLAGSASSLESGLVEPDGALAKFIPSGAGEEEPPSLAAL